MKPTTNIVEEDRYRQIAEFIMEAATRLDRDPNDIVIGVEFVPQDKRMFIDVYDMEFNILERF